MIAVRACPATEVTLPERRISEASMWAETNEDSNLAWKSPSVV